MRIGPPEGGASFFDHTPELFATFEAFYGELWQSPVLDQATKEVARLRNARVTGCGICRNLRFAGAVEQGLTEDFVEQIQDGYAESDLPDRWKLALRLADVVIGPRPGELDETLRKELLEEFSPAEIVELVLTTAIAQGMSKGAVAWGPAPDIPLMVVPTPGQRP